MEEVILVNEKDKVLGYMEKQEAHIKGLMHRAFSIFVFNDKNELLLQKRAIEKYHSGGLWTNTCCSHPRKNETNIEAAYRRLNEEMGISCVLNKVFTFTYKAVLDKGLTEHEFDHVFFGFTNQKPKINTAEVSEYKYISISNLEKTVSTRPELFTEWFLICFPKVINQLKTIISQR
ncbi:MAG: isopentenyl-diphosphate Delta-isomerase [Flavobacteriales bacterium]|nr:isopentenyl-diphosphate Delta-isomerase [Flavobacteriales bacterium]